MGIEARGKIHAIMETQQITERFTKREFVVETTDNPKYPQLVLFQCTGDRCAQLDDLRVGDDVTIDFSVRGREYIKAGQEPRYFNSLDVWRVEAAGERKQTRRQESAPSAPSGGGSGPDDDIPFATCDIASEPNPIARVLRR